MSNHSKWPGCFIFKENTLKKKQFQWCVVCAVSRVVLLFYQQCRKQYTAYTFGIFINAYSSLLSCTDFKTISPHPRFPLASPVHFNYTWQERTWALHTFLHIYMMVLHSENKRLYFLQFNQRGFSLFSVNLKSQLCHVASTYTAPNVPGNYNRNHAKLITNLLNMSLLQNRAS